MTNEEIDVILQEIADELKQWSEYEKELTKQDKRHINLLFAKKDTLEKLKEARAKGKSQQEFSLTVSYGLLTSIGEKYPLLISFIKSKTSLV